LYGFGVSPNVPKPSVWKKIGKEKMKKIEKKRKMGSSLN